MNSIDELLKEDKIFEPTPKVQAAEAPKQERQPVLIETHQDVIDAFIHGKITREEAEAAMKRFV